MPNKFPPTLTQTTPKPTFDEIEREIAAQQLDRTKAVQAAKSHKNPVGYYTCDGCEDEVTPEKFLGKNICPSCTTDEFLHFHKVKKAKQDLKDTEEILVDLGSNMWTME